MEAEIATEILINFYQNTLCHIRKALAFMGELWQQTLAYFPQHKEYPRIKNIEF